MFILPEGHIHRAFTYVYLIYDVLYAINSDWWLCTDYHCEPLIYFQTWKLVYSHWITAHQLQTWAWMQLLKLKMDPFPLVAWVNGKSHIPTMTQPTIPGQSSVLHLKAYLTFHSFSRGLWAARLGAWPRLAFWQTMWWIKGHTWPLSCSLGDQTHFQDQELLTGFFFLF